jgi:hypothetical protein
MDDEREIIFVALSNSLNMYNSLLETKLSSKERELIEYTINRHLELIDKYHNLINEGVIENKPIGRPKWD